MAHINEELSSRLNPKLEPSKFQLTEAEKGKSSQHHILKKYKSVQKENRKLKTQLRKTKKKEWNYKSRLAQAEKALSNKSLLEKVTKNMTLPIRIFTGMQYRHGLKKPKGRRYNLEEKILSLSIYKKSPKCYAMISEYFKLPSAKSLRNLLKDIKVNPGVNKPIFEKIKETVSGLRGEDRLCTLAFDEMSIEPHIYYNAANDEFKGFVSTESDAKIANHALVFMIKGLKMNFKQPVAYYLTQSLKTIKLKEIIKDVIRHVHSTGLKIVCTVCDQGTTNVSAINSLVADTKEKFLKAGKEWRTDFFIVDEKKIIPLYDVPHLIKGIRNNLLTKDLKYVDLSDKREKIVKWSYFEMLYEADKARGELTYLHKITEEHIYINKIKKMRVKMAAQVFSKSVAATADHLTARNLLPEECRQLIPLVLVIDKLFDSLNAGTFHIPNGKIYRDHKLWQDGIKFLKGIKFLQKKKEGNKIRLVETCVPTVKNFIKTIEGIQELWKILNKRYAYTCMLTRNLNQDPVENFFGNIRSLGVRNVKPDCFAFEGAFKTLLLNNYSCKHSINANCEEDFASCLQTLEFLLNENKKGTENTHQNIENNDNNVELSEEMFGVLSNVQQETNSSKSLNRYVCGWVLQKCLKKVVKGCKNCKATIISHNLNHEDNAYIKAKEFNVHKYWLCYPSNQLANCFDEIQDITTTFIKTNFKKNKLKENVKILINSFVAFPFECSTHKEKLKEVFIDTTVHLLIYSWCKSVNQILSGKIKYDDLDDPIKKSAQAYYNAHKNE